MQDHPSLEATRLAVARQAVHWALGGILDVLDDPALPYLPHELCPRVVALDIDDLPMMIQRRGKLLAARLLIGLASEREALTARGADPLESVLTTTERKELK
jgi:hypothetical protein